MKLWEKKLRNAIQAEIRGLVNEGKLDLTTIADNMQLDVSDLLAEADTEAGTVDVVAKDGELHVHVTASAQAEGDTVSHQDMDAFGDVTQSSDQIGATVDDTSDAFGDQESDVNEADDTDAEDEVVSERWQRLAGLIRD